MPICAARYYLARVAGVAALAFALPAGAATTQGGRIEDTGVRIDWRYESLPDSGGAGLGRLSLQLRDSTSLSPLRYQNGQIAAWLQRQRNALSDNELRCTDKVKTLATQGIGRRADIDLNTYRLVTLNRDKTVAFINPFVGLNNAKLESILELPGTPQTWLFLRDRMEYWVRTTAPERLVVIDAFSRRIARNIELPTSMSGAANVSALNFDGQNVWFALPGAQGLAYVDVTRPTPVLTTESAPGIISLSAVAVRDGHWVLASYRDARVTRWQVMQGRARVAQTWQLARPAQQFLYSELSDRVVAHDGRDMVTLGANAQIGKPLSADHPIEQLSLFDAGRYALAVGAARMSLFDLASSHLRLTSAATSDARTIAITNGFVYALSATQSSATLWSLADLRAGRAQPVNVLLGSKNALEHTAANGLEFVAVAPTGTGLLVANAADALVYQYAEGMMAPVGSFSNYKRSALALSVLDLAPRETAPGRYEVTVRHDKGGKYELVLSGVGPRFAVCDRISLSAPSGATEIADTVLRAKLTRSEQIAPLRYRIEIALQEMREHTPVKVVGGVADLTLVAFDKRVGWQQRAHLREVVANSGRYAAELTLPSPLQIELFAGSVSKDLAFADGRIGSLQLGAAAAASASTQTARSEARATP